MIALPCGIDGCESVHVSTLATVEGALIDAILDAGWSSEPEDDVPVLCAGCTELVADGAVYSCEECGALAYAPRGDEATLCEACYSRPMTAAERDALLACEAEGHDESGEPVDYSDEAWCEVGA